MSVRLVTMVAMVLGMAAAPAAAAPGETAAGKKKMRCETVEEVGTRLGRKRVCRTEEEWQALRQQTRQDIERNQTTVPLRGQ